MALAVAPETQFPIAKGGMIFIAPTAALAFIGCVWIGPGTGIFFTVMTLFLAWFFRDPRRSPPQDDGLLLSPADGMVVDIARVEETRFLKQQTIKISIFLNIFDIHVNRVPMAGKVVGIAYNKGRFFAANVPKASLENEQNALMIEAPSGRRVVCVQIAGLIARRIVCWVREGSILHSGERFGLIRFGSRVDVFLPTTSQIRVACGERVIGGETILGVLK